MRHSRRSAMPTKRAAASADVSRAARSNRSVNRLLGRAHGAAGRPTP